LITNKHDLVIACDPRGRIQSVIRADARYGLEGLVGQSIRELCEPHVRSKLGRFFREIKRQGVALSWELALRLDGQYFVMNAFGLFRHGQIYIMASDSPDNILQLYDELLLVVNEQNVEIRKLQQREASLKHPEAADRAALEDFMKLNNELLNLQREMALVNKRLSKQERRLRRLLQKSPDMMFVQDAENRVIYLNEVGLGFIGADTNYRSRPLCLAFEASRDRELTLMTADGLLALELRTAKIEFDGRMMTLVSLRDVSVRMQMESLREDIDRISRHDLKSPLNAIIGLPQVLLEDENLDPEQREMISAIMESGYRMLNMINLSLGLHQMERGVYELTPVPVNLLGIVGNVQKELASLSERLGVGVVVASGQGTADETMPYLIHAEELLCHCLLSNLLKNAIEASPRGANVHVEFRRGTCCDVFIHNLGEVPAALRLTFFDKYTTFGKKMGTGLGTYSAKLMARTMGGDVSVDCSQPGKTQVRVSLPWCQTALEQSEEKHEISHRR